MYNKSQLSKDQKAAKESKKLKRPVDKTVIPGAPKVDPNGYWDPANVGRTIEVPLDPNSRSITMSYPDGTPLDQPLIGVGTDTGMVQYMMPGQDYIFPFDNSVVEDSIMEDGGQYMDLDEDEIAAYRAGGYVVEELPKAQDGNATYISTTNPNDQLGYNATWDTITYNPNSEIENINNPWWKAHEDFHHKQNMEGRSSTFGLLGQRPNPYVASDDSMGSYYNRRQSDLDNEVDKMIQQNPSLQFIPRQKLYDSIPGFTGATERMYRNPSTEEGEAREVEMKYHKSGGVYSQDIPYPPKHNPANSFAVNDPRSMAEGGPTDPPSWNPPSYNRVKLSPERMDKIKAIHGPDIFNKVNLDDLIFYDINKDLIDNTTDFTPFVNPSFVDNAGADYLKNNGKFISNYMQKKGWALDTKTGTLLNMPPDIMQAYLEEQQQQTEPIILKPRTTIELPPVQSIGNQVTPQTWTKRYNSSTGKWTTIPNASVQENEATKAAEEWRLQNPQYNKSTHSLGQHPAVSFEDGGGKKDDKYYTYQNSKAIYRRNNGNWEVDWNRTGNFQKLSKGDVMARAKELSANAKPLFDQDYYDMIQTKNQKFESAPKPAVIKKSPSEGGMEQEVAQKNFDRNFKVTDKSNYEKVQDKTNKLIEDTRKFSEQKGIPFTKADEDRITRDGWNIYGNVYNPSTGAPIDPGTIGTPSKTSVSFGAPTNPTIGDYAGRALDIVMNPLDAFNYSVATGDVSNMPWNYDAYEDMKGATGYQDITDRNAVSKTIDFAKMFTPVGIAAEALRQVPRTAKTWANFAQDPSWSNAGRAAFQTGMNALLATPLNQLGRAKNIDDALKFTGLEFGDYADIAGQTGLLPQNVSDVLSFTPGSLRKGNIPEYADAYNRSTRKLTDDELQKLLDQPGTYRDYEPENDDVFQYNAARISELAYDRRNPEDDLEELMMLRDTDKDKYKDEDKDLDYSQMTLDRPASNVTTLPNVSEDLLPYTNNEINSIIQTYGDQSPELRRALEENAIATVRANAQAATSSKYRTGAPSATGASQSSFTPVVASPTTGTTAPPNFLLSNGVPTEFPIGGIDEVNLERITGALNASRRIIPNTITSAELLMQTNPSVLHADKSLFGLQHPKTGEYIRPLRSDLIITENTQGEEILQKWAEQNGIPIDEINAAVGSDAYREDLRRLGLNPDQSMSRQLGELEPSPRRAALTYLTHRLTQIVGASNAGAPIPAAMSTFQLNRNPVPVLGQIDLTRIRSTGSGVNTPTSLGTTATTATQGTTASGFTAATGQSYAQSARQAQQTLSQASTSSSRFKSAAGKLIEGQNTQSVLKLSDDEVKKLDDIFYEEGALNSEGSRRISYNNVYSNSVKLDPKNAKSVPKSLEDVEGQIKELEGLKQRIQEANDADSTNALFTNIRDVESKTKGQLEDLYATQWLRTEYADELKAKGFSPDVIEKSAVVSLDGHTKGMVIPDGNGGYTVIGHIDYSSYNRGVSSDYPLPNPKEKELHEKLLNFGTPTDPFNHSVPVNEVGTSALNFTYHPAPTSVAYGAPIDFVKTDNSGKPILDSNGKTITVDPGGKETVSTDVNMDNEWLANQIAAGNIKGLKIVPHHDPSFGPDAQMIVGPAEEFTKAELKRNLSTHQGNADLQRSGNDIDEYVNKQVEQLSNNYNNQFGPALYRAISQGMQKGSGRPLGTHRSFASTTLPNPYLFSIFKDDVPNMANPYDLSRQFGSYSNGLMTGITRKRAEGFWNSQSQKKFNAFNVPGSGLTIMLKEQGGTTMDLTPEEIQLYKDAGYVIMEEGGSYVDNQMTHFQDAGSVMKKPSWYKEDQINPSAFVSGYGGGEEPNTYKYAFLDNAGPGQLIGGAGFGIPKYGVDASFTGIVPTSPEEMQYFKGVYGGNLSKQFKDVNLGLGVKTAITGYPGEEGFVRDPMSFEPSVSLKYNFKKDGGPTLDPGNNALELHMFYDKTKFQKGGKTFQPGQIYTFDDNPNVYYKLNDSGNVVVKNKQAGSNQYVAMNDPEGTRRKTLEYGLTTGKTNLYGTPEQYAQYSNKDSAINDFFFSENEAAKQLHQSNAEQCLKDSPNCLSSTWLYYDRHIAPNLGLPSSWQLKENAGIYSGPKETNSAFPKYGESADSWDIARAIIEGQGKSYYAAKDDAGVAYPTKKFWKDLNLPVGAIINAGSKGGGLKYGKGDTYNEGAGLVPSNHSAMVGGFDEEGVPYIYDYGKIYKATDPNALVNAMGITNITAPKELTGQTYANLKKQNKLKDEITDLSFNIPDVALNQISDIDEYKPFLKNLESNKSEIMSALGISNKTYDEYAKRAAAIALTETGGGNDESIRWKGIIPVPSYITDKIGFGSSQGITQINTDVLFSSDKTKKQMNALGITKDNYDPYNSKHIAAATMIMLADADKVAMANLKKHSSNKQDLNPAAATYYQWNSPSTLVKGEAQGDNINVKRFMQNYNMINSTFKQDGGSTKYLTQKEIDDLRTQGYYVIED